MLQHRSRLCIAGLLWLAALVAGCAADGGDDGHPSRRECEAFRDRIVAQRLADVTADRDQHEANLRAAFGPAFVERCVAHASRDEVR